MKVGIFTPCYREQVHIGQSYMLARLCVSLASAGMRPDPFYRASACLDAARNWAVNEARRRECHVLLMVDADVFTTESTFLADLLDEIKAGAAVAGAAVATRDGRENTTPDGAVGTGLMLIDLRKLADLPQPWFRTELDERGEIRTGEDVGFCRRVMAHGRRVAIVRSFPTTHVGEQHLQFSPAAAVNAAPRDGAPQCAVEHVNG
jgi:hypothetical protein